MSSNLRALTSLRFVAAAMIVFHHSEHRFGFGGFGGLRLEQAVSFFFVLSGFILCHVYPNLDRTGIKRFFVARFARIWPVHLFGLALTLLLIPSMIGLPFHLLAANLTLTHSFVPLREWFFSYNSVSWSLSTEVAFYCLFPFLVRRWEQRWGITLIGAFVVVWTIATVARVAALPVHSAQGVSLHGLLYIHPASRLFEFVLGMCTALAYRKLVTRAPASPLFSSLIELCAVVAAVAGLYLSNGLSLAAAEVNWLGPPVAEWLRIGGGTSPLFAGLILIVALQRGRLSLLLAKAPFVRLGEISYVMYVVHYPLNHLLRLHTPGQWERFGTPAYLAYWLFLLLLSHIIWQYLEQPCRDFILTRLLKKPSTTVENPRRRLQATLQFGAFGTFAILAWHPPAPLLFDADQAKRIVDATQTGVRDVSFGQRLVLQGARSRLEGTVLVAELVWTAERHAATRHRVVVEFLERGGSSIARQEYASIHPVPTSSDAPRWIEQVTIDGVDAERAVAFSIRVRDQSGEALKVDSGPTNRQGALVVERPVPQGQVRGSVDRGDCKRIEGWAQNIAVPMRPITLDVFVDTTLVASVWADEFRPDLRAANVGDGRHAFGLDAPALLKDGRAHTLTVKAAATDSVIEGSPRTLQCTQ